MRLRPPVARAGRRPVLASRGPTHTRGPGARGRTSAQTSLHGLAPARAHANRRRTSARTTALVPLARRSDTKLPPYGLTPGQCPCGRGTRGCPTARTGPRPRTTPARLEPQLPPYGRRPAPGARRPAPVQTRHPRRFGARILPARPGAPPRRSRRYGRNRHPHGRHPPNIPRRPAPDRRPHARRPALERRAPRGTARDPQAALNRRRPPRNGASPVRRCAAGGSRRRRPGRSTTPRAERRPVRCGNGRFCGRR